MQTFTRWNPPVVQPTMAPAKVVREVYDFARDENHNLIVVQSGTKNFDEMAAVAAEGCDFRMIHEALRSGSVVVTNEQLQNPTGERYGDTSLDPHDMIDVDNMVKAKAAAVLEAYNKLPEDLRGNMTIKEFSSFVQHGGLKAYSDSRQPQQPQQPQQEVNENAGK